MFDSSEGVEALTLKWISNGFSWGFLGLPGVNALFFKWISILSHRLDRACAERLANFADYTLYVMRL